MADEVGNTSGLISILSPEVKMENLSDNFPVDAIDRCARRLQAIVQYHRAGVGGSQEPKHLIFNAATEALLLRDVLKAKTLQWGLEFPESPQSS
jgi:hypothetical protein